MGLSTKPLTDRQAEATKLLPCDGVARFVVRGYKEKVPYSQAYQIIRGETDPSPGIFSRDGLRRIMALNRLYLMYANEFVEVATWRIAQARREQKPKIGVVE